MPPLEGRVTIYARDTIEEELMNYWIGQALGAMVTLFGVTTPLFKKKWQMLMALNLNNICSLLSLVFLGEIGSGIFLFIVSIIHGLVNTVHSLRGSVSGKIENVVFMILYVGLGFYGLFTGPAYVPGINVRNMIELLPILGAALCMCFISAHKEKTARLFYVGSNGVWAIYYAIIGSSAGINSVVSVASGLLALYRNREK